MNKTDRMLAIVLELQRKKMVRAEDLAALFETSVRTIYRDMQALSETGVPIVGAPGTGYSLMEGYFLPPVSFTSEEAVALLIGTDFVKQQFDTAYGAKALASAGKIEAVLPEGVRQEAQRVRTTIRLLAAPSHTDVKRKESEKFALLRDAVLEQRKIRFHYSKGMAAEDGNRHSVREAAPYGLALSRASWLLLAYCELRQELRHFRVSRMSELTVLEQRFQRPPDFELHRYVPEDDRRTYVKVWFDPRIADLVKESSYYYMDQLEEAPEGLIVTLKVRQPEEVLSWILGWGAQAVVLEPESLKHKIREEAASMLKHY